MGSKINRDIKIYCIRWLKAYKHIRAFKYIIILYCIKGKWGKLEVINKVKWPLLWPFHYILSQLFVYMTEYQPYLGNREMVTIFCSSLKFRLLAKCLGHNRLLIKDI